MENKNAAAFMSSAGTDERQPSINTNNIITENLTNGNSEDEYSHSMLMREIDPYYLYTVPMTQLFDNIYGSKQPIIDNFLYVGTYLFAGAPKIGKSFFMAQLAYHVSMGIPMWEYPVHQGTVLYLALEDTYARLQNRMSRMFGTDNNDNLHFATKANNLSDDLDKQLESFISEHGDTKLIIIDTLQKIREAAGENYSYGNDYDLVARLKRFTDKYSIALILVHHTRKQSADDCFDTISGTNGLLGAADGAFLLQKDKRTDNKATLDVAGRDQQDQRLKLMFDMEHCIWQLIEAKTELWQEPLDEAVKAVAEFISVDNPLWCGTASELIERLALDIQPNSFTRRLNVNAGRLLNEYGIQYESSRSHAGRQIKLCRINTA